MTPRRVSRDQLTLRLAVGALPPVAVLCSLPDRPGWWLLVLVAALSAWWGCRPESAAGAVTMVLVLAWWGIGVADPVRVAVLPAAGALAAAHVAATVAGLGPPRMRVDRATLRLWARRGLLGFVVAPVAWLGAELVTRPGPADALAGRAGLRAVALVTLVVLCAAAAVALRTEPDA